MNCPTCGHSIERDDSRFCPNCAAPLEPEPEVVEGIAVPSEEPKAEPNSVPFEDKSRPFLERYWQTLTLSFSNPKQLLSGMKDEGLTEPVIYAMITGTLAAIVGMIWQFLFGSVFTMFGDVGVEEFAVSGIVHVFVIFLMPFLVVAGLFIWTAIYHLCLLMLGTKSRGFGITLRAIAYGYGPNLLAIIPICGGIIGGIWSLVLTILGAFYGHRTDAWRAIVAYFIPLIVCCGIMMFFWFMIIGIAATQNI